MWHSCPVCSSKLLPAADLRYVQGAATTVYAVTAAELEGKSGSYLANCAVATPSKAALDDKLAAGLWDLTHKQLQEAGAQRH